ncbi:hypothetical protein A6A04_07410 [Paramagnetospirillum marisnigri]|uniref:Uncharacterized protein n=1 Tax=Paramagnetospirillum marisnigri TaxID=1285242 RepID=A0A178MAX0_9PROT|nr:hypothetical protein [Paramagnetospirillum marisnigri]OAN45681.1 hypothetical protein A6A04_07280 [Paramagnetospirillum marisnigri]OAN45703.1 hypothetical protein A6A04_07410 [Paramagnetospirillum marisnigri]
MENWARLMTADRELSQAFDLLDRAREITLRTPAAIVTREGLVAAARDAVTRVNGLLKHD